VRMYSDGPACDFPGGGAQSNSASPASISAIVLCGAGAVSQQGGAQQGRRRWGRSILRPRSKKCAGRGNGYRRNG